MVNVCASGGALRRGWLDLAVGEMDLWNRVVALCESRVDLRWQNDTLRLYGVWIGWGCDQDRGGELVWGVAVSRQKLRSRFLRSAQIRLSNLRALGPELDLGNVITVPGYEKAVQRFEDKIETYNRMLAAIDGLRSEIRTDEAELRDLYERVLLAVGARYGKDSAEYKKAGGVRKSERKQRSVAGSKQAADTAKTVEQSLKKLR